MLAYEPISYKNFLNNVLTKGNTNGYEVSVDLFSIAAISEKDDAIRENLTISCCIFSGYCDFRWLQRFSKHIKFSDCLFKENTRLIISELTAETLEFDQCELNDCELMNLNVEYIRFDNCTFKYLSVFNCIGKSVKVEHLEETCSNESGEFSFHSPQTDYLSLYRISLKELHIRLANDVFVSGHIAEFNLNSDEFRSIEVGFTSSRTKIDSFKYDFKTIKGLLSFQTVDVGTLSMENILSKDGAVKLQDVTIEKTIIHDCTFGDFTLNVVEFGTELSILRCNLQGLRLFNVRWPNKNLLHPNPLHQSIPFMYSLRERYLKPEKRFTSEELNNLSYQRDTYRQLKAAAINNYNHIESLDFYRNEMRLFWKEIRIKGGVPWRDRLLFFLNRWVSDFGQNWVMPLGWLLVINVLYLACNYELPFSWHPHDWLNGLMKTVYYMNPARKLPEPGTFSELRLGFDVLLRVENAFLIFHFLRATRRLVKM
jgi:hypothetical protein